MTPRALPLLLGMLVAGGCRGAPRDSAPAPSSVAPPAPDPVAPEPATPVCVHRRPFNDSDKPLVLPAPFDVFTPCDVVPALGAGEKVRIDHVRRWDVRGRTLLAALYYRGEDAEGKVLCETCRAHVHVGIVERRGATLVPAGKVADPWQPGAQDALFNGRSDFDAEVPFDGAETLLAVKTPWSSGASGTRTILTLYRLVDAEAKSVFEETVSWMVDGKNVEDDDEVSSSVTTAPGHDGPNDILLKTAERRCHYDYGSADPRPICRPPQHLGAQRWRFDESAYRRVEGKAAPLPRVLRDR